MNYFIRFLSLLFALSISLMVTSCGSGGGNAATSGGAAETWAIKTNNHGLGQLTDQILLPMSNGDLYLLGSKLVTVGASGSHTTLMAKSTDGGITWSSTGLTLPTTSTGVLYGFQAISNGTKIVLTGGLISYANGTTPPLYNTSIFAYTPSTNTWQAYDGTVLGNSFSKKTSHAMAFDGVGAIYISGGSFQAPNLAADGVTTILSNYPSYRVWKSLDAGASWSDMTSGVSESASRGNVAIHKHCMVASGNTLTIFGGEKAPIHTEVTGPDAGSNFVTPSEISVTTTTRRSVDGGSSWTVIHTGIPEAPLSAACAQVGSTLYSSGGLNSASQVTSIVRKSTDGGFNWTLDGSSTNHGFRFDHSMAVRNGKVLVFGGSTAGTPGYKTNVIELTP